MRQLAGRYELHDLLGSGGMARVFAAHDTMLDRPVAVKLIRDDRVAQVVDGQRLLREARGAAALHHPNTVAVFDAGEEDGQPFIVMEFVRGISLADQLRDGPLPVDEALAVLGGVLAGLGAAHARGLIHRDVKPSNILLPADGGVKLADFGIAKAVRAPGDDAASGDDLTATGEVLGTPRYLAPEQAAGAPPSPAADLYSAGVVAYECLAGRAPFEGDTAMAVALAHQRDPVPPLASIAPHVPPGIAAAVERALAKDPADRFRDAAEMRAALQAGARGAAVPATTRPLAPTDAAATTAVLAPSRPTGPTPRSRRWVGPALLALVVLVAVALAAVALRNGDGAGPANDVPADAPDDPPAQGPDEAPDDEQDEGPADEQDDTDDTPAGEDEPPPGDEDAAEALDDLIAELETDPEAAGEKGEDLLDELREVQAQRGNERRREARDAIEEIADWLDDDEIDRGVARRAVFVLEPLGRPPAPALADLSALFAEVALDQAAWGENGDSLLSGIAAVLDADGREQADEASGLLDDVDGWADDGEIPAERARRIRDVVGPLT